MISLDWKREMSNVLANVETQLKLSLHSIKQSGLLANEEFKTFFFQSLNDRASAIYTMFETELQLDSGSTVNQITNSAINDLETNPPGAFSANESNVTESVTTDDSNDEEIDDSRSNMDSRSLPDENVGIPKGHQYSTRSRNENATKKATNRPVEEDSVQQENYDEANDMETIASDLSAIGDGNTSEAESNLEMESNDDRELEQSSGVDEGTAMLHVTISSGIGFNCPIRGCFNVMKHKRSVNTHVKLTHGFQQPSGEFGVVRFVCKLCKILSHSRGNFKRHFKRMHPKHSNEDSKMYLTEIFIKTPPLKYK